MLNAFEFLIMYYICKLSSMN